MCVLCYVMRLKDSLCIFLEVASSCLHFKNDLVMKYSRASCLCEYMTS